MRAAFLLVGLLTSAIVAVAGQSPAAPAFDVVSIKENTSGNNGGGAGPRGADRWMATNMPLHSLLGMAWGVPSDRVVAPDWTRVTRYDIDARGSVAAGWDDILPKAQRLLRERFAAMVHIERRDLPTYNLVQSGDGRPGPSLRPSPIKDCFDRQAIAALRPPPRPCGLTSSGGTLTGTMAIRELVVTLTGASGRPVFDKTSLTGNFEIDLKWTPSLTGDAPRDDSVSIFTAVQSNSASSSKALPPPWTS